MKLKKFIRIVPLLYIACMLCGQNLNAQSFLTADYPEYATKVKLRYQQASFKYLSQSETACGIYNISVNHAFNHRLSGTLNIPVMADYTVSDDRNVRAGNFEVGLNIINARWKNKATVVGLSFVVPFGTQNINNRENAKSDYTSLYQRACLTDFARCNWYLPGVWTAMFQFHFHYKKNGLQLAVGAGNGIMARKTSQGQSSMASMMIQPSVKLGYEIKRFSITGELLNAFYINSEKVDNLDIADRAYFMGTIGISYKTQLLEAGIFYQNNMSSKFQEYAVSIFGVQCMIKIKKQEIYLKSLKQ